MTWFDMPKFKRDMIAFMIGGVMGVFFPCLVRLVIALIAA